MTSEIDTTTPGPVVDTVDDGTVADVDIDDSGDVANDDWITDDDFDRYEYAHSIQNRFKQGWIVFQATMMTIYMIIGVRNYGRLTGYCHWRDDKAFKIKALFVFQTVIIFYLVINEFTRRHITGIFLVLLFTQFSLFITFNIVVDSMIDYSVPSQSKMRIFNNIFRVLMWGASIALFVYAFLMNDCYTAIYPKTFIAVTIIIFVHQIYDIFLCSRGYMQEEELPQPPSHRLWYNRELFQKQSKCLLIGNLIFGLISVLTVASGYFIVNRQHVEGANQHLLCVAGYEWIYLSPVGNIFGTLHQLLVLMQINITQYVLVRIPRNMGLFNQDGDDEFKNGDADTKGNAINDDRDEEGYQKA